jgi:hypothetical protein
MLSAPISLHVLFSPTRPVYCPRAVLASPERSLVAARDHSEPAGQIADREMEIVRIKGSLQRAEINDDVAAAIEQVL